MIEMWKKQAKTIHKMLVGFEKEEELEKLEEHIVRLAKKKN